MSQAGGRVGDVRQAGTGRNLHTEEQIGGPGGQASRLLQSWRPGGHTLSHVFLQSAGHAERHLTEPALVDILPHPPVSLHMSEESIIINFNILNGKYYSIMVIQKSMPTHTIYIYIDL